jgi:hypothetical protein
MGNIFFEDGQDLATYLLPQNYKDYVIGLYIIDLFNWICTSWLDSYEWF